MSSAQGKEFFSESNIPIERLYTPEHISKIDYTRDIGLPGEPPFTRGVYPGMYRDKLWTIRRYSGFNTPEETNQLFRREYEIGQTGFSIAVDGATNSGIDSDDPRVVSQIGDVGVPIDSLLDMEIIFDGLPIDKVATSITSSAISDGVITAMYLAVAEQRGIDWKKLRGATASDITSCPGSVWFLDQMSPRVEMGLAVDLTEWCTEVAPLWDPVYFDSYNYRENGIDAVQELGLLLATAIAYIEEEKRRGRVPLDKFTAQFGFNMSAHNDLFEEVAKFRAARRMWYKIARERYGIENPACWKLRFHVQSAGCTHTTQEPFNNLIRIAYQVLAAVLGGAQSIHANGFDEGVCLPTDLSMLLSIRNEQILQHETNVINTVDPLGGSYYVEWLTSEMERRAWEYIEKIESMGDIAAAIESGWLQREYTKAMIEREGKINSGEISVIGVNKFRLEEEPHDIPIFRPDPPRSAKIQLARLEKIKNERDNARVGSILEELKKVTLNGDNVMPTVMEAVKAYATLGEIVDVWRGVHGLWRYPLSA